MKKFKHWKYQVMIVAPFLPWLYVQHLDFTYQAARSLGWDEASSVLALSFTTIAASVLFVAGYANIHKDDD